MTTNKLISVTTKELIIMWIVSIISLIAIILGIFYIIDPNVFEKQQAKESNNIILDLPEEWDLRAKTDTFIGIERNDTLFIHFKH